MFISGSHPCITGLSDSNIGLLASRHIFATKFARCSVTPNYFDTSEKVKGQLSYSLSEFSPKRFVFLPHSLNAAFSFQMLYKLSIQVLEVDHLLGYS